MKRIKINDEVAVISGKHKGQSGRVLKIDWKKERVTIDKVNIVKKHQKPTQQEPEGGIKEFEAPIHISNVAVKTKGKDGKKTKIAFKINDKGNKVRISKATGKEL
ncbi:MAG: 50S ribosomal protein L24 [Mollicutes bacterium PWAP]|nr:50S ribosomal protein L24 [Mollicutes bacterium PWAP]